MLYIADKMDMSEMAGQSHNSEHLQSFALLGELICVAMKCAEEGEGKHVKVPCA
jgi:hypothetical protein